MKTRLAGVLRRLAYRLDRKPAVVNVEVIYDEQSMFDAVSRYHEGLA